MPPAPPIGPHRAPSRCRRHLRRLHGRAREARVWRRPPRRRAGPSKSTWTLRTSGIRRDQAGSSGVEPPRRIVEREDPRFACGQGGSGGSPVAEWDPLPTAHRSREWIPATLDPVPLEAPVPGHGLLARLLLGLGVLVAGPLLVAGGIALRGPGLVAVVLAGVLAACTAAGIARESPRQRTSTVEAATQGAGWTVGVLLAIAGVAALAGAVVAVLVVMTSPLVGGGVLGARSRRAIPPPSPTRSSGAVRPVPAPTLLPVAALSTAALGQEWLRTTRALAGRLTAGERQSIVRRREETLDELERRDPSGFARWLAAGAVPGSDPAGYVRGGPVADSDAA